MDQIIFYDNNNVCIERLPHPSIRNADEGHNGDLPLLSTTTVLTLRDA